MERGKIRLEHFWPMMDAQLEDKPWIAGEHFSLADIDMYCINEFAGWIKDGIPASCGHLSGWLERAATELGENA